MKMTISAEKEIQIKSTWIQSPHEHKGRTQSISCKKIKRKKTFISIRPQLCGLFFSLIIIF